VTLCVTRLPKVVTTLLRAQHAARCTLLRAQHAALFHASECHSCHTALRSRFATQRRSIHKDRATQRRTQKTKGLQNNSGTLDCLGRSGVLGRIFVLLRAMRVFLRAMRVLLMLVSCVATLLTPSVLRAQDMRNFSFHLDATSGNGTEVDITGLSLVGVTVTGSTTSNRVLIFEVADSVGAYSAVKCTDIDTSAFVSSVTLSGNVPHRHQCYVAGFKKFRVRITGGTTGTVTAVGLGLAKSSAPRSGTQSATPLPGGGGSIGPVGTLQSSDGNGAFSAYTGSDCSPRVMSGLDGKGTAICEDAPGSIASPWLSQPSSQFPQGMNMGALASGIVTQSVVAGVATPATVPIPQGGIAGLTASQTLTNTLVLPRPCPALNTDNPIVVDLNACDGVTVANLLQDTTIANPVGTAGNLQWMRFQICSVVPRALVWGSQWSAEAGIPLPSATLGGGACNMLLFQYNAYNSHMVLVNDVSLTSRVCIPALTPGTYVNTTLTVDARGCISVVASGTGGGGSAAPAGALGDVQLKDGSGLAADSGVFTHDVATHWTRLQQLLVGSGTGAVALVDPRQFRHTSQTTPLTQNRWETKPDASGTTMLAQGGVTGIPRGSVDTGFVTSELSGDCTTSGSNVVTCGNSIARLGAPNPQSSTYQVLASDFDQQKTIPVSSNTFTVTLVASTQQPSAGKYIRILNYGSGVVTIARSGQNINSQTANIPLSAGSALAPTSALVVSDGTNYLVFLAGMGASPGDAVADGTTKGVATFSASDFNSAAGVISIDYTNGQAASASLKGFLAATAYAAFNKGYIQLPASGAKQPATNPGVIDNSGNNTRIRFDDTTQECVWWQFRMNADYASAPVFKLQYAMFSDSGAHNIAFDVSVMVTAPGAAVSVETDSYDTVNNCDDATIPTTLGGMKEISCALTNNDGMVAGAFTKIKLCRDVANDNATGDAMYLAGELEYVKN
jgi:hypothetical protein